MLTLKAHINRDGQLILDLPDYRDLDVEVVIREANEPSNPQLAILDIPPLTVDPRHSAVRFLSREELYDDDGR